VDGKISILNERFGFSAQKILNYLGKITGNLINYFDILKFIIAVIGDHCWHSTRVPKNLGKPLDRITEFRTQHLPNASRLSNLC
jgi:hypothetical protein